MLNINELTAYYLEVTFSEEIRTTINYSFMLMELFGIKHYEDKYTDLISRTETIDNDAKQDLFIKYLNDDVIRIINDHHMHLNEGVDYKLFELNELAHFLYIIQNLEDYTELSYILHSEQTPRMVIVSLIVKYSLLSQVRAMELLGVVEPTLLIAIKEFVIDKEITVESHFDRAHLEHINHFIKFTQGGNSLGERLYLQGYPKLTLEEYTSVLPFNLVDYVDGNIGKNAAKTALDVLSLLVMTKDNYLVPLLKFKQNTSLFTSNLENVTKLSSIMVNILADFSDYLKAQKDMTHVN
jgi:hypothetical protein